VESIGENEGRHLAPLFSVPVAVEMLERNLRERWIDDGAATVLCVEESGAEGCLVRRIRSNVDEANAEAIKLSTDCGCPRAIAYGTD